MTLELLNFYVINPTKTTDTNLCTNPSFETNTTGWSGQTNSTIVASSANGRRGYKSLVITPTNSTTLNGARYGLTLTNTVTYTFSVDVYASPGQTYRVNFLNAAFAVVATTEFTNSYSVFKWFRKSVSFTATSTATFYVHVQPYGNQAIFNIDGVQVETGAVATTYFDGNSEDCYWSGTAHASTSIRKATTRVGGTLVDLSTYFSLSTVIGLGMNPYTIAKSQRADGRSIHQKTLKNDREFILMGEIIADNYGDLQTKRAALINLFKPDLVTGEKDLIIRYVGTTSAGVQATEPVNIRCRMRADGLIGNWSSPTNETLGLVFEAYDDLTRDGEQAQVLGYQTTVANMANIMQRSADGVWAPLATGLNGAVYAMAIHPITGDLYLGGEFTDVGGTATTDYLVKWNGTAFVEVIASFAGKIHALVFDASGNLYIGGDFLNAGGVPAADYICKWNGSTITALGTGAENTVLVLAMDSLGNLYAGGNFASAGGVANTNFCAKWDGSVWTALGAVALNDAVIGIICDNNNNVYIGGNFTNAGGVPLADYICKWDGTAYTALSTGANNGVYSFAFDNSNNLIIGGTFTSLGGIANTANIGLWNGVSFSPFGKGLDDDVRTIYVDNNEIMLGGIFTRENSGVVFPDRMAIWTGTNYVGFDINVQDVSATIYEIIKNKNTGTLYVGGLWTGTNAISATVTTPANLGTSTYPKFTITGPGTIWQIKNYTNGKTVYFDGLTLLAGEVITLDFDKMQFTSTFRGNIMPYIIEGISTLDFNLEPGSNNLSAYLFGSTSAASSITATWKVRYWSLDEAKL